MRNAMILSLALLMGCATQMPSLAGKTTYKQTFSDIETDGNKTEYSLEIKAPAGVKLDDLTGMEYTWDPEKGKIAINKSGSTDTSGQAAAIVQTNQRIMDSVDHNSDNLTGLVRELAPVVAPLIGKKMDTDATIKATDQANDLIKLQSELDALKELIKQSRVKPATPKPASTDAPAVALPK